MRKPPFLLPLLLLLSSLTGAAPPAAAQTLSLAQSPLFLGTAVKPNVLVVLDNSQSMDGTMSGRLIAGSDASTRGNIARSVLRDTITGFRTSFRWGLASFELRAAGYYTTYAYYFGSDAQVVYTNDCVAGISASNGNRRCVANPQTANGYAFITYAQSGDDSDINDVLYTTDRGPQIYGVGVNGTTSYDVDTNRTTAGTSWNNSDFSGIGRTWTFTPTDAGFLPSTPPSRRMLWLRRAWGWYADVTGKGVINRGAQDDSATHYNALMAQLAPETATSGTGELKNAAVFTPLAGTLDVVNDYFSGRLATASPITDSCQRNFVLLATDGNPTSRTNGNMYTQAEMANTYNATTGTWSFGTAASDVFTRLSALRAISYGGTPYDVQTYVIGLGDSVANQSSLAALDRMAALGGTTAAYRATDQTALEDVMRRIAVDIASRTSAAAAVALNSGAWSSGSKVYQARFASGDWSGQLMSFAVGSSGAASLTADWEAGQRLNAQDWSTGRQIITYRPSGALGARGVAFRWPANPAAPAAHEIDAGLVSALNASVSGGADGFGAQRLAWLRGQTSREARNCPSCSAPVFRNRPVSVLGDIINSSPVYVGGPTGEWRDTMETTRYSSYAAGRRGVTPAVFVGANDGMLHAFSAVTGNELFAYVPYAVRNRLSAHTATPYAHVYSVDGSPTVGDVFYGGSWHTVLVAGLNAGAPGLYALDIGNTALFDGSSSSAMAESNAAQIARWELADADVGHIFGKPILAKTRDGRWRAIVGNGYNSASGKAALLLVDLETGVATRIDTLAGTAASPSGLSAVTAVSSRDDGVADIVYAGDLGGRLWKFDLSSSAPADWKVAYGTAAAPLPLYAGSSSQPITARPSVSRDASGSGWLVVVGTGRYLDTGDNATTGSQQLLGIRDLGAPVTAAQLQLQTVLGSAAANGNTWRLSTHAVARPDDTLQAGDNAIARADYDSGRRGWRIVLPATGERIVTEAVVRSGRVLVSTLIPSGTSCAAAGDGWVMVLDAATGNRIAGLDTNGDNAVSDADRLPAGIVASGLRVGAVPSVPSVMRGSTRSYDDFYINTSDAGTRRLRLQGSSQASRRAAWEQLQ